jgi:hypothetical protein
MNCHTNVNSTPPIQLPHTFSYIVAILTIILNHSIYLNNVKTFCYEFNGVSYTKHSESLEEASAVSETSPGKSDPTDGNGGGFNKPSSSQILLSPPRNTILTSNIYHLRSETRIIICTRK